MLVRIYHHTRCGWSSKCCYQQSYFFHHPAISRVETHRRLEVALESLVVEASTAAAVVASSPVTEVVADPFAAAVEVTDPFTADQTCPLTCCSSTNCVSFDHCCCTSLVLYSTYCSCFGILPRGFCSLPSTCLLCHLFDSHHDLC